MPTARWHSTEYGYSDLTTRHDDVEEALSAARPAIGEDESERQSRGPVRAGGQ
jgi:hypothetical protein